MVVFVVHWVKRKSPWSKSVRTNGFGTQQWQTRLKNGSSPTTLRNLHTHTHHHAITFTAVQSPRPAPRHPAQLLLQVGNHWHLIDWRLDLQSCQVLRAAQAPFHQHVLRILSACPSTSKSKALTLHPCHRARKQDFESQDWPNHLVFLSWLIVEIVHIMSHWKVSIWNFHVLLD